LFGKLFIGSKSSKIPREFILKKADVFLWNKANKHLLLSVHSTLDSCKGVCINWSVIDVAATTVGLMRTIYSDGKHNPIDKFNHEKMVKILFVWPTSHGRLMSLEICLF
jgi:endoribonuclease Dicer